MTVENPNPNLEEAPPTPQPAAPGSASAPAPALPPGDVGGLPPEPEELTPEQKRMMVMMLVFILMVIIFIVGSIVWLANQPPTQVALIRDIFIIWMAIMSLLISLALVILMVQLARLINLLQNEIKPILDSTNETVSHLRGTTVFLSENLAEPVIKLNEYLAGISQFIAATGFGRKSSRSKKPKGE